MDNLKEQLKSPLVKGLYGLIVVVLLVMIVYHLRAKSTEHAVGSGLGAGGGYFGVTSGATIRNVGTEFSGTNQQERQSILTADAAELGLSQVGKPVDIWSNRADESLVGDRSGPNFWEIGSELAAYKRSQAPGLRRAAGQEHATDRERDVMGAEDLALSTLLH